MSWISGTLWAATILAASTLGAKPLEAQWGMMSEHHALVDKTVVDVGVMSHRSFRTPDRWEDDPILNYRRWIPGKKVDWLEFTSTETTCFVGGGTSTLSSSEAALLLKDESERTFLAGLTTYFSSVKVELQAAIKIDCPKPADAAVSGLGAARGSPRPVFDRSPVAP